MRTNVYNVSVIFDFDIDGKLDAEVSSACGFNSDDFDSEISASDLIDEEYNDVCEYYGVPGIDMNIEINKNSIEIDEQYNDIDTINMQLMDIIQDMYNFPVKQIFNND